MTKTLKMNIISSIGEEGLARKFAEQSEGGPIDSLYFSTAIDKNDEIVYSIMFFRMVED